MKKSRLVWILLATAVIGVCSLTMTQFAATQEVLTGNKDAKQKNGAPADKRVAERNPRKKELSDFMRMKLEASQQILEGLTLEDFELIQAGAAELEEMSAAEKWRVTNDPLFREESKGFQRATQRLSRNGQDGKLEAAALTWMEVTTRCIECHKWTRAHLIADVPRP